MRETVALKGGAFLVVVGMGIFPLLFFAAIILGVGTQWTTWQPPLLWTHRYWTGNSTGSEGVATAVALDNSGLVVAEFLSKPSIFYAWYGSIILARYDPTGQKIWTQTISDNYSSIQNYAVTPVAGVALSSNNIYLSANSNETSFLMKYDGSGNQLWISRFGGPYSKIRGVAVAAASVYTIGDLDNKTQVIQAHDESGGLVWSKVLNNSIAIKGSPLGLYVLTRDHLLRYDVNGDTIWKQSVDCMELCVRSNLSMDNNAIYVQQGNGSIRKYAADGSLAWEVQGPFPNDSELRSLSASSSGVYTFVGIASGFLAKYDSSGRQVWSVRENGLGGGWSGENYEPAYLASGLDGVFIAGEEGIEKVASSSSLEFLGINPPWSFVTLGALIATIVTGIVLFVRRTLKEVNKHPKPIRERGISSMPSD